MTDRFVGPGGSDGNDGLTWANRKLTLNGVEDTPVVANDTVFVGPGVYRENLIVDVSGSAGNIITYIGDVTGENTDGIGGVVRITGSDNDTTITRAQNISLSAFDFRTFRGFLFDMATNALQAFTGPTDIIIEDCTFQYHDSIVFDVDEAENWIVRRCFFIANSGFNNGVSFFSTPGINDGNNLVENCIFYGFQGNPIRSTDIGGMVVRNCTIFGGNRGVEINYSTTHVDAIINNCFFTQCETAVWANAAGHAVEDFNAFWKNATDRTNISVGGSSNVFPLLSLPPVFFDGIEYRMSLPGMPSEWSPLARIAGTSEATDDLFGIARPTTSGKKSWGAIQLREGEREASTVRTGSAAIALSDAADHQIFIPTDGSQITVDVFGRFETDYAGTKPQLIIRQPGAADSTDTMTGGANVYEPLSLTITPDASPDYVVAIIRSLNTATSGSFAAFFDDLQVT